MKNNFTSKKPKIRYIDLEHRSLCQEFDGFKIIHLSDLHNKEFGTEQSTLLNMTESVKPDIILVTGDIIDRRNVNIEKAIQYFKTAVNIASVYFSSGNHEHSFKRFDELKNELIEMGVNVLDDKIKKIKKGNQIISIIGVNDLDFFQNSTDFKNTINRLSGEAEGFKILMSHKPHKVNIYKDSGVHLVLSGHAHGGQIRLPIIGGLYAPGQGLFPRFTSGLYKIGNDVSLVVNRGLGDSVFPWRINNPPEIILITLKTPKDQTI